MGIDLADFENQARNAVMAFWGNRETATQNQIEKEISDRGGRAGVTAGKNMDGFVRLIQSLVAANGLHHAAVHLNVSALTLPGYFRPTKRWDILVTNQNRLVAAIELKSQVGSFGNNFNNRTEEAIGTAHDFWTAYREGAFGQQRPPFVGWLMLVEDAPGSVSPIRDLSPHFPIFPEFQGASYLNRYDILCQKLVKEQLYTSACVIASPQSAINTGEFRELSHMTSLRAFVAAFAGHIAGEAANSGPWGLI